MDAKECRQWLMAHPTCYLATLDGEQPRVRCMSLDAVGDGALYFHMPATKAVFAQAVSYPRAEACFCDIPSGVQIRVRGLLERDTSPEAMEFFLTLRPELKGWIDAQGAGAMGIFRMKAPIADITTRMGRVEVAL